MTEFANRFRALDDPRVVAPKPSGPPPFPARHHILVIAFSTMLCGGQTGADMELFGHAKRELLQSSLPETGKRHPQPRYILTTAGYAVSRRFSAVFTGFMQQFAAGGADAGILAFDGKTLRRSYDRAEQLSPLHPVSAWAEAQGLVLGQGNRPWTPNPTPLRRCPSCWQC